MASRLVGIGHREYPLLYQYITVKLWRSLLDISAIREVQEHGLRRILPHFRGWNIGLTRSLHDPR